MKRALALLASTAVLASVLAPGVAGAEGVGDVRAWLGTPAAQATHLFVESDGTLVVSFGVAGPAGTGQPTVTLDATGLAGVTIEAVEDGSCELRDNRAHCQATDLANGTFTAAVRLRAASTAEPGAVGMLVVTAAAAGYDPDATNNTAQVPVYVQDTPLGADLQVSAPEVTGRVGDVIDAAVTVRNDGPNPESFWGLAEVRTTDEAVEFAGVSGCAQATLAGTAYPCARAEPMLAGTAVTVTLRFRVTARPDSGGASATFLVDHPLRRAGQAPMRTTVSIRISGTNTDAPPVETAPSPVAAPPSPVAAAATPPPARLVLSAQWSGPSRTGGGWVVGAALIAGAGLLFFLAYRRRGVRARHRS